MRPTELDEYPFHPHPTRSTSRSRRTCISSPAVDQEPGSFNLDALKKKIQETMKDTKVSKAVPAKPLPPT
jgi:hypothetical protein